MKKISKLLTLILTIVISVVSIVKVSAASSAPKTITVNAGDQLSSLIGGTYFTEKITSDGKYAYCLDKNKNTPNNVVMTLHEEKDAGLAYLMVNGYPNKSITGNNKHDYYITQTAVWWYLDETTGSKNITDGFKTGQDQYDLRKHVIKLKDEALKARTAGYEKPELSLVSSNNNFTLDGNYYYSSEITVKATAITGKVSLSLTNAPKSAKIVDSNNKEVTSVEKGAKVRIQVPVESAKELSTTIKITANATSKVDKAYMYKPESSKVQPVVVSVLFSETNSLSANKDFTLKTTKVEIIKIDAATKKPLEDAKLELKNSKGEVVASWTTTKDAKVITNLPAGNYTLVEKEAPNGYKLSTVEQNVVLENGKLTKVTFENTKKPTSLSIIKKDKDTGSILAGATFSLKDSNGKEITTWISTNEAHVINNLPEGIYTVEELNAPEGYIKTDEKFNVTLEAGKPATVVFYNIREVIEYSASIKITKVNGETNENLAGATLVLKDINGNVVATWETTTEEYEIKNIKPGTYFLSEEVAPEGFVLSEEVIEITVTEDGGTVIVTFYNIPEVEVPNTLTNTKTLMLIVGGIASLIGGSIIYITLRKEENFE